MVEHVVLVDEHNTVLGTAPKADVHTDNTPLHRAFSVFLFNKRGELLLQQRAHSKKTWPGVWSNSCCGHPQLNEQTVDAASRRIREELGMEIPASDLICMLPHFRYTATFQGVQENELCPVFVGRYAGDIIPNPDEVQETKWVPWNDFLNTVSAHPGTYSVWCEQEARLLAELKAFREWL